MRGARDIDDRSAYRVEDPIRTATGYPIYLPFRVSMNEKNNDRDTSVVVPPK